MINAPELNVSEVRKFLTTVDITSSSSSQFISSLVVPDALEDFVPVCGTIQIIDSNNYFMLSFMF